MKKSFGVFAGAALAVALTLVGCQTAKPIAPAQSVIRVEEPGFAPQGNAEHSSIEMALLFGNGESIKSWTVSIMANGLTLKSWTGTAAYLPASQTWDGNDDNGTAAREGTYTARLTVDYVKTYQSVTEDSSSFILDRTPPAGSITLEPAHFVPSDQGVTAPVTLHIEATSKVATMASWKLDMYDVARGLVKSFSGLWPGNTATWDGSTLNGGFVTPTTTYEAVATVSDEFGLSSELKVDVPVTDIPMATQQNLVQPNASGFSPLSESLPKSIDFAPTFGNVDALKSWKISVVQTDVGVQKTWTGDAASLPQTITWDGRTASGIFAPEGSYAAILSIDYGKSFQPVLVRSAAFLLDITPPGANVSVSPAKLAGDRKGGIQPVTFTLYGNSLIAGLKDWTLGVLDTRRKAVASFEGTWPPVAPVWNGSLAGGGKADPTQAYTYVARIRDEFGNVGEARGSLATGELPVVQGVVSVTPKTEGFSPSMSKVMVLAVAYGQPDAVTSWKLTIGSAGSGVMKTFNGSAQGLPRTLSWDGKTDQGTLAADGSYTAKLSVSYGRVFAPATVNSSTFLLVTAPPTGSINLSDPLFSPIVGSSTITLTIAASSELAKIDSWTMDIYDPGGNVFRSFAGKWPADTAVWDGKGTGGDLVQSAEDYPVVAKIRDEFGNIGTVNANVPTDILVEKTATGYRILASRIFFKAFTADYKNVPPEIAKQNLARLDALSAKLKKFPDYKIRMMGHAVMINWNKPAAGRAEQQAILIPLSKARAEAMKAALIERGLDASRFTAEGVGASDQMVPDSDYKDRWQNRRVAFFLDRQ